MALCDIFSGDPFKSEGFTSDPFASDDPFKDAFPASNTSNVAKVSMPLGEYFPVSN